MKDLNLFESKKSMNIKNEDIVKNIIILYLDLQARALLKLRKPNLDNICSKELCNEINLITKPIIYKMEFFNCKLLYYRIVPNFIDIYFEENLCTVKVFCEEILKFDKVDSETLRCSYHKLELIKINNKWIICDDKNSENNSIFKIRNNVDRYSLKLQVNLFKHIINENNLKYNYYRDDDDLRLNRGKMKLYQIENWNKRPKKWGNFDGIGGDCTNYASQVIYSGGSPMVTSGKYTWYYYGYNNRAPSWTSVELFYRFLIKNNADAVHGVELQSSSGLKTGDIIQLDLDGDGIFNHTAVVFNPIGYMGVLPTITSHSLDRFNEPIITFKFTAIRWIHLI